MSPTTASVISYTDLPEPPATDPPALAPSLVEPDEADVQGKVGKRRHRLRRRDCGATRWRCPGTVEVTFPPRHLRFCRPARNLLPPNRPAKKEEAKPSSRSSCSVPRHRRPSVGWPLCACRLPPTSLSSSRPRRGRFAALVIGTSLTLHAADVGPPIPISASCGQCAVARLDRVGLLVTVLALSPC